VSYMKKYSSSTIWKSYCNENHELIEELQLPIWVFSKELNFREYATTGKMDEVNKSRFDFDGKLFWKLFSFITNFFDFDLILFIKFEESRIKRLK